MLEAYTGCRWKRGTHTAVATSVQWVQAVAEETPVQIADTQLPATGGLLSTLWREANPADASTKSYMPPEVASADAGLPVALALLPHLDAGQQTAALSGSAVDSKQNTVSARWPAVHSVDAPQPVRWTPRLVDDEQQTPLLPPAPYVPPLPLVDVALPIAGAILLPQIIDDLITAPTPAWTGRALSGRPTQPLWVSATSTDAPLRMRWVPRMVIYGGAGAGSGEVVSWPDREVPRVPWRQYYVIIHDISVVRLPDRTPLPCRAMSLSVDADRWAWAATLDLVGASATALIEPSGAEATQIEISINGAVWVVLAEDWAATDTPTGTTVRVTGRGLSALLSSRYSRPRDYTETAARTAAQLAEAELPVGGGWTLTWSAPDWLVPAGAWTYQQQAPIDAIARIAAAAGALIRPAMGSKALAVVPVWKKWPWELINGDADIVIPKGSVFALTRVPRIAAQANAVAVYGGETGGILGLVTRAGSAGDEWTQDVSDPLITHADAARALGGRTLAKLATPAGVASITMAVDPYGDFPLVSLGQIVHIDGVSGALAPCTSVEITASLGGDSNNPQIDVKQTLGLGDSGGNLFSRLLALLPREARILATVLIAHGDGTVTVQTWGGGTARVRGSATVGAAVWVRGGRIEGPGPSLASVGIDI